jgi:hypothetical protein
MIMFCPNCAAKNDEAQTYCRSCGLKIDAISRSVAEQFPSKEYAAINRRKELFERFGVAALSISGVIGLMLLLAKVFYWKLILFGPEVLFYSATGAMILFGLLSVVFFNYGKIFLNFDKLNPRLPEHDHHLSDGTAATNRRLDNKPFEPASVTEHSTELLSPKRDNSARR